MVNSAPVPSKLLSDGLVEKRAVDTCLYFDPRQCRAHTLQTVGDEGIGPIGVVDITGAVVNIKYLVCLRNGTKQADSSCAHPSFSC